jgi:hypothetical protein
MSSKKRGAPTDRLDAILDAEPRRPKDTGDTGKRAQRGAQEPAGEPKARATFYLGEDLLDRLRNAADALSGPPVRARVNGIVSDALRRELARLERKHSDGNPFPPRPAELSRGRKLGK